VWRRTREPRRRPRGAVLTEAALTLPVFLTVVLAVLDLGIGLFVQEVICQAARQGVRQAIVHGRLASPRRTSWGPTTYTAMANASGEIPAAIRTQLAVLDPARVSIRVDWIDGGNDVQQRVRVTVSTTWTPMLTSLFGSRPWTFSAASTMPIAH
jgi:Flp pilus assembly protein TadG